MGDGRLAAFRKISLNPTNLERKIIVDEGKLLN